MENMPVTIGRYRLSKTLGIGAFGKVKREFVFSIFYPGIFCFSCFSDFLSSESSHARCFRIQKQTLLVY